MPTACINQSGSRVRLVSERLEIFGLNGQSGRDEVLREIPIRDLDRLIVSESVQVTSKVVAALMRRAIPISVIGWNGRYLGGFLPAGIAHGNARLQQYRRAHDDGFALGVAGRIVSAKLYNQRRVLQRLAANRKGTEEGGKAETGRRKEEDGGRMTEAGCKKAEDMGGSQTGQGVSSDVSQADTRTSTQSALKWLDGFFASITRATTVEEVRGYEGASTARYFQAWASFLPPAFPFERRSTRPPLNAVNACVSFGATLLYGESTAFLHAHGLDPAIGFLHTTDNGRWSLALDLIEPFRPVLVEALALDLFSHQVLNENHFEPKNGGVYLNEAGRKKFYAQYERRMERQFMSECAGHRTTLRQQLEHQAVMLKSALENPEKFEPFLMN